MIPEIKFTLPPMSVEASTMAEVEMLYDEMIVGILQRAVELHQHQVIVEFELLPEMTINHSWGESITALLRRRMDEYHAREGFESLLRITPVDIRESTKPPLRRSGPELDTLLESFRRCASAGADLLSIESTGGKEVTDPAIMAGDIQGVIFGTTVLGCRDMEFLWERICGIAQATGTVPAGDTACGIGNTAMILADQGYIPKVFAAVVRAVTAARSLVAYEVGAVGPGKDCGYENAILKAITGYPMSLEGKSAACAHFSSIGNIAGAYADAWSNESVQHIKLLSGMAPVVSMEQLIYDCRLMNVSVKRGRALDLRDLLVESDASLDPQAFILQPTVVLDLAKAITGETDDFRRGVRAAETALDWLEKGFRDQQLQVPEREAEWLKRLRAGIDAIPGSMEEFLGQEEKKWKDVVNFSHYGL